MATDQGVGGSNPLTHVSKSLENKAFLRDFFCVIIEKHTKKHKLLKAHKEYISAGKKRERIMAVTWEKVEANIGVFQFDLTKQRRV